VAPPLPNNPRKAPPPPPGPWNPASPHDTRRRRFTPGPKIKINEPHRPTAREHSHPGEILRATRHIHVAQSSPPALATTGPDRPPSGRA
jgi:hypothetical protein